jgi:hypothetical protein
MSRALNGAGGSVGGRASAWAYFLALSPDLLDHGGRLAAVLPADVLASDYGTPLITHLQSRFSGLDLIYCDGDVFPSLSQRTVLLLAEGRCETVERVQTLRLHRVRYPMNGGKTFSLSSRGDAKEFTAGETLPRILAPENALSIEARLQRREDVKRVGEIARVELGYVTGDNDFFHMSQADVETFGISVNHLTSVLTRERDVPGLRFTLSDWKRCQRSGTKSWLLTPTSARSKAIRNLLRRKAAREAQESFKCTSRTPWWRVPVTEAPAAFMIYMGTRARIVSNAARVHVPNTFFKVSTIDGLSPGDLAVASLTSVFRLSAILNSRLLGGGLPKLGLSDAGKVLIPVCSVRASYCSQIEQQLRKGEWEVARRMADRVVLERGLGWNATLLRSVQAVVDQLVPVS